MGEAHPLKFAPPPAPVVKFIQVYRKGYFFQWLPR